MKKIVNSDMSFSSKEITNFWKNNSKLTNIYPKRNKGEYPENKKVFDILTGLIEEDKVVEYGCGYGRLAPLFKDNLYTGIDINNYAIEVAKSKYPNKKFITIDESFKIPLTKTVFAYTVFHHIPIEVLHKVLYNISKSAENLIIAEMINGKSNPSRMPPLIFRGVDGYKKLCELYNFKLIMATDTIYESNNSRVINFLKFENKS